MSDASREPFWKRKRWIAVAVVGCPLAATSVTSAALLSLRHVPASTGGPWVAFLAFLSLAAVNAALAVFVPSVVAARLSEGRAAVRVVVAVACGAAGLTIYLLTCFLMHPFIAP